MSRIKLIKAPRSFNRNALVAYMWILEDWAIKKEKLHSELLFYDLAGITETW